MSFPPKFADFGKKTKDLFKKTYEYKKELKVINKAPNGVTIETWGAYDKNALTGFTKAKYADKAYGEFELEVNSASEVKGKAVSKKVSDVTVTVEGNSNAKASNVSAEGTWTRDRIVATVKANHTCSKDTVLTAAAVFGQDGIAIGGHVNVKAEDPTNAVDFNLGAECQQKDLTMTVVTSDKLNDITFSYFQTLKNGLQLGSSFDVKPDTSHRLFTFGGEYDVDKKTKLKFKADSTGLVASSVTHTLADPAMKLQVAAEFNTQAADVFTPQSWL